MAGGGVKRMQSGINHLHHEKARGDYERERERERTSILRF
jgi:hypothetical protein